MTIYFDANKKTYNYPVEGYIATVEDYTWAYYSQPQNMDKWDIVECKFMDITNTENYKAKKLAEEKEMKIAEIKQKNKEKYSLENKTITVELPAILKKGEETKQVTSFNLLTMTSAGQLATVLMGNVMLAQASDIPDLLNDDNGYTIVGLNELVNGQKFINLIFAKVTEAIAKITNYQRYLINLVEQAETVEQVWSIAVDFDRMSIFEVVEEDDNVIASDSEAIQEEGESEGK